MSDIFVSYKREDQAIARKLANALEKEGWSVWWDPKLRAGERFNDVIEKALKESKCVVVMWSKRSVESQYVKHEANYALKRNKLVPIIIEEVELPFRFEDLHTPSLLAWDGSNDASDFRRLVEDVAAIMGGPGTQAKRKAQWTSKKEQLLEEERQRSEEGVRPNTDEALEKLLKFRQRAISKPGTGFRDNLKDGSSGPEMVVIPAGTFQMGDFYGDGNESERPVHTVRISKPFAIGRYEVTFEEYDRFAATTGRELAKDNGWGRGRRPVINVSWSDAVEYADWLAAQTNKPYRLPTEAEWEYAARSGGKEERWAGTSCEQELSKYAWYATKSGSAKTKEVGRKKPNGLGLHDMCGNVGEWVQDEWHDDYEGAPSDEKVWLKGNGDGQRVIRDGSWFNASPQLRSTCREGADANLCNGAIGFRLARDID